MAVQTIAIHVVPNARVTCVAGHHGGAIKIKLHAPAIEGRANDELIRFVAESLGIPRASVRLVRGAKSREKIIAVEDFAGDASGSLAGAL